MPRTPNSDLHLFQEWLQFEKMISNRTSSAYASAVRRILTSCSPQISEEVLDNFLLMPINAKSKNNYMVSWKHFASFMKEKVDMVLPLPSSKVDKRRIQIPYTLPTDILDALDAILNHGRIKPNLIPELRHHHIRKSPRGSYEIIDPLEKGYFYNAPVEEVELILRWGDPSEENKKAPFLPTEPFSGVAVPFNLLRRLLGVHRRTHSK